MVRLNEERSIGLNGASMTLIIGGDFMSNRSADFQGTMYSTMGNSLLPVISVPSSSRLSWATTALMAVIK
jgi:hypothetical protein